MDFLQCVICAHPTGSRYICDPPVLNTDNDTIFLVNGYYDYDKILLKDGWKRCADEEYEVGESFQAYRKGDENYIVTEDDSFYFCFVKATEGAKALNLKDKSDRIALFQGVVYKKLGFHSCTVSIQPNR